jgi:dTMP kinase
MGYKSKPGILLTLEGIDGSGISTLAAKLYDWFLSQEKPVIKTFEPGDSPLGTILRSIMHEQKNNVCDKAEFLLMAADRAQHFHQTVIPALEAGKIVISDRMADSSLAYQGYGRGLDRELIQTVNAWAMSAIVPDCTIYLKFDPSRVLSRVTKRHGELTSFEQEKTAFWQRVSNGYDEIFAGRTNVITIDATQDPDVVFGQTIAALTKKIDPL